MTRKKPLSHLCAIPGCGKERRWRSYFCSIDCLFWSKFDRSAGPDGCWIWTGSVNPVNGYGDVPDSTAGGKRTTAHRRAYTLTHGDPGKLSVLHKCDMRLCGNPAHLFPGTHRTNWLDSIAKGRQSIIVPGEGNAAAKLTPAKVVAIRQSHLGIDTLAQRHRVNETTIIRVILRETWQHVPDVRKNGDHPDWIFMTGVMEPIAPMLDHSPAT